jgi:hypothetical protein
MIATLVTVVAVMTGAPLSVWAVSALPTTPHTWRRYAQLAAGLALLLGAVAAAAVGTSGS